jgi:hypothetical protein
MESVASSSVASSSWVETIRLNSVALEALRQGHLDQCIVPLTQALRMLQGELGRPCQFLSTNEADGPSTAIYLQKVKLCNDLGSLDLMVSPSNVFSIYNHAFHMNSSSVTISNTTAPTQEEASTFLVVLFYNLALVMHLHGLLSGKDAPLQKALYLYQASIALLQDLSADTEDEENNIHVLSMALWMNQGYIHSHFLDSNAALVCFEEMYAQVDSLELMADQDDRRFFLDSLANFLPARFAPAA